MRENIENNLINSIIKQPNLFLFKKLGFYFISIKLDDFGYKIILSDYVSSNNLISLFILYYTLEIVKKIV
jgi:hypothetical protein